VLRLLAVSSAIAAVGTGCGRWGFAERAPDADADAVAAPDHLVFTDETQLEFELGSFDAGAALLEWSAGQIKLASGPPYDTELAGIYISRPFEADDEMGWDTLAWTPIAPQGRPLPAENGTDVGYAEASIDMADNILLLRFDAATVAHGAPVADASGQGHDGVLVFAGQGAAHVEGTFGEGLDLDRDAFVSMPGSSFDYGTGDFTYAVWIKNYPCADSNDNRVAFGGGAATDRPHMWIGARCPDTCPGGDHAFMNFLDSTRAGPTLSACTGVVLHDGGWHHLVGVKQGHSPAVVRLYVDGREVAFQTYDFGANTFTYNGGEIRLGSFNLNDPQYHTRIVVDEAAIWKRALTAADVQAMYRRGTARLELQIRVCADGACDTEPFVGPDGTSATAFTEADLAGSAGSQRGNLAPLGLVGRVAQYRARFATTSPAFSPGLVRVVLEASRR
jgi:hypothetical protein